MANRDKNPATVPPAGPAPSAIRMGSLAGGALGLLGFSLAVFSGLAAGNSFSEIITRAFVTSLVMAAIGGLAGLVASHLLAEHAKARQQAMAGVEAGLPDSGSAKTRVDGSAGPDASSNRETAPEKT